MEKSWAESNHLSTQLGIFNYLIPQPKLINKIKQNQPIMVRNKYFFTSIMNIYIPENYKIYKYNPDIDDEDMGINILAEPLQKYSHKINVIKYTSIDDINKKKNVNSKMDWLNVELILLPVVSPSSIKLSNKHSKEEQKQKQLSTSSLSSTKQQTIKGEYTIEFLKGCVKIISSDSEGLFHGVRTLSQIFHIATVYEVNVPTNIEIIDYPSIENRGVMLDITRGRVPTMKYIQKLITMLASFKYNQLQLYCEHAFAYKDHPDIWKNSSPITGEELKEIDKYCALHHIKLIPSQNTLGHMHRWLKHEKYKHLAECPNGNPHPFSLDIEPYSLNVTDERSFELSIALIKEMREHVRTKNAFNVNLDEVFDLGLGRSNEIWKKEGTIDLFLGYLNKMQDWCKQQEIENMMCWGDFYHNRPETVHKIPKEGVTILEWGYDDWHPFLKNCKRFDDVCVPFYVCPGTSSWASFAGRTKNTIRNLHFAAVVGQKYHNNCKGFLMTDWGDLGCPNPPSVSYLPYIIGADASWGKSKGDFITDTTSKPTSIINSDSKDTFSEIDSKMLPTNRNTHLTGENDMPTMLDQNWTCTSNIIFNTLKYIWEHMFLGKFLISILLIFPGIIIGHVLFFLLAILFAPFGHRICQNYPSYIKRFNKKYNVPFYVHYLTTDDDDDVVFEDEPNISKRYVDCLNLHVFKHDTKNLLGDIACNLGNAYLKLGHSIPNGTLLFWGIMMPDSFFDNRILGFIINVVIDFPLIQIFINIFSFCFGRFCCSWLFGINEVSILETKNILKSCQMRLEDIKKSETIVDEETTLVIKEMEWLCDVLKLSCDIWLDRLWIGVHVPISKLPKESKELKIKQFDDLIQRHKKLWIQRSRPGGLDESIRFLNRGREMIMV